MDEDMLSYIHMNKTARMLISPLRAALELAGCGPDSPERDALTAYGVNFGLLFQTVDDILDVVGDKKTLGKSVGKDAAAGKLTSVSLYGLNGARSRASELACAAAQSLEVFGERAAFFMRLLGEMEKRVS
jgi:geranylgeranyl diphosphate synthase type II